MNFLGIVNKPQFDLDFFKVGKAIHIIKSDEDGNTITDTDAIIMYVSPLEIGVCHAKEDKEVEENTGYIVKLYINIKDVITETVKITDLKECEE